MANNEKTLVSDHSVFPIVSFALSNYPISPRQQIRRDRQANLLGGFQIDQQLEFHRLLDRQVGRLGTLQDLIHVGRRATPHIFKVRAVRREATVVNKALTKIDCRELILRRKINDLL